MRTDPSESTQSVASQLSFFPRAQLSSLPADSSSPSHSVHTFTIFRNDGFFLILPIAPRKCCSISSVRHQSMRRMTSGSTFTRRRAVAKEARRQRAEISDGKEPGSAPRKIRRSRSTVATIVAATRAVVFNTRAGGDLFMIRPCLLALLERERGMLRRLQSRRRTSGSGIQ